MKNFLKNEIEISIIIPVYNGEEFIQEALDSIFKQEFQNCEIIIINDGSNDNTLKILEENQKIDDRIRVYSQTNKGRSVARNRGIELSYGRYLMFLDADDEYHDSALENAHYFINNDNYDVIYGDLYFSPYLKKAKKKRPDGDKIYKHLSKCEFNILTTCIKKDFLVSNSIFFPINYSYGEDVYFFRLLVLYKPKVKYVPKLVAKIRLHSSNSTINALQTSLKSRVLYKKIYMVLKERNLNIDNKSYRYLKKGEINQAVHIGLTLILVNLNRGKKILRYELINNFKYISIKYLIRSLVMLAYPFLPFSNTNIFKTIFIGKHATLRNKIQS